MDPKLFYEAMEHIPIGIFILDAQGNYLYVNRAYCNTVCKDKTFFDDMSVPKLKELGYLTTSAWEQVMEKKQKVISVISIVDKHLNRVYDTLTTGMPIFDKKGNVEYIIFRQETVDQIYEYTQKGALNKHLFRNDEVNAVKADDIIAASYEMKRLLVMVDIVARTDASILVTGPSGSGKEIIAKRIHRLSNYRHGPLIILNCAALPESLMESELFGYETGAFTGASGKGKKGLIETATGGTLFLDEINSMLPTVQAKLLRVLETKQVTRVGGVESRDIQFRLVCASNENLYALVNAHRFRADLFYRINVFSVDIPPLCRRKEDVSP
ncbi:MAG: sigma 54-interacting transcriptional regulator, partial [Clostridiales Family XIII bacterium]|nr:sigma 54-interacting transcriptional regulator [Clostridiales Family XIII bacterium]